MNSSAIAIQAQKVLIVEGKDEELFFDALLLHLQLHHQVQILAIGGKTKLRQNLQALRLTPGFQAVETLAVIRDADDDPQGAFHSVTSALQAAGFMPPSSHATFGTGKPRAGVFIFPDGVQPGALEDLCLLSVDHDPAMPCVAEYFRCLQQNHIHHAASAKARVQVFLAARSRPILRIGEAAQAGCWPWDHPVFAELKTFLLTL